EQARLRGERAVAADAVDGAISGRCDQPPARIGRRPLTRPALGRDREGLLGGFLGEIEVAEEADQARQDAAPLVAEDLVENGGSPLLDGTDFDRSAQPGRRNARRELDRRVEVVRLEEEVA